MSDGLRNRPSPKPSALGWPASNFARRVTSPITTNGGRTRRNSGQKNGGQKYMGNEMASPFLSHIFLSAIFLPAVFVWSKRRSRLFRQLLLIQPGQLFKDAQKTLRAVIAAPFGLDRGQELMRQ